MTHLLVLPHAGGVLEVGPAVQDQPVWDPPLAPSFAGDLGWEVPRDAGETRRDGVREGLYRETA